jgi:hypothetical protein
MFEKHATRLGSPNTRDLVGGVMLVLLGLFFAYFGASLRMGTASRMGPGYLPLVLSWGLVIFGVVILTRAFMSKEPAPDWPKLRPLIFILLGPVLFGLLIQPLGLIPTIVIVALVASYAAPGTSVLTGVISAIVLAFFCAGVFVYLLSQPIPLWPEVLWTYFTI